MKILKAFFLLAGALMISQAANAERITLQMNDVQLQGQSTIYLKQELQRQYPNIRINDLELSRVRLVAKTRHGQGSATLQVSRWTSAPYRVNGHPADFHRDLPRTFDRVDIENGARSDRGVWQIHLRGNFKVRKVVLFVEDQTPQYNLTLNFGDNILRGANTLYLKRELQQQFPNIRVNNLELISARLVAKSHMGRGTAQLQVGRWLSSPERVGGNPRDFFFDAPRTFDRIDFANGAPRDRGVWQIDLRGNIKVRKVVLTVQEKR